MVKKLNYVLALLLWISVFPVIAQPINDSWDKAIPITSPSFCSNDAEYSTINAKDEGVFESAPKWTLNQTGKDVWFKFTATAYYINITVTGNSMGGGTTGGSLLFPLIALYTIDSSKTTMSYTAHVGAFMPGNTVSTFHKGNLIVGNEYYIRVSATFANTGTFKLCLNNFFPPVKTGQDFNTASFLCNKSAFTENNVLGSGIDNMESMGSCLGRESNTAWYKWKAATDGILTMDITPIVNTDDIDWVLYDLGTSGEFSSKTLLRCASGHGVDNTGCPTDPLYFKTGMNLTSSDLQETMGCGSGGQDGYVKFADLKKGHIYALLVDNFSNGNNGFKIEFGGTSEFEGPVGKINLLSTELCISNPNFNFTSTGSANYEKLEWDFGEGASIAKSTDPTPPAISYFSPGYKTIVLTLFNAMNCSSSITYSFLVNPKTETPIINGLKSSYCLGDNIELSTDLKPGLNYLWTGPNGFTSTLHEINILIDNRNKAGVYNLQIIKNGCSSEISSVTIPTIGQEPNAAFIQSNNNLCSSTQSFTFTNNSTAYTSLRWDFGDGASVPPGSNNPINTIRYSTPGTKTIKLEAIGNTGCINVFSKDIDVSISPSIPLVTVNQPEFCEIDFIKLSTPHQDDVKYQWTGPNGFTSNLREPQIPANSPLVAGTYSLILSRGVCVTLPVTVKVKEKYTNPIAEFSTNPKMPFDLIPPFDVKFLNESVDADAFLWDFGDGNTSTEVNPTHTFSNIDNINITLTAFKNSLCSNSITKGNNRVIGANAILIPNTFTPNNDGVNDFLTVTMLTVFSYKIQIFNRFGVSLFRSEDINNHWNGSYNGEVLPVGTYYYLINAVDLNGDSIQKAGSVTIIK
jgi:gliding motility-associated-like protein